MRVFSVLLLCCLAWMPVVVCAQSNWSIKSYEGGTSAIYTSKGYLTEFSFVCSEDTREHYIIMDSKAQVADWVEVHVDGKLESEFSPELYPGRGHVLSSFSPAQSWQVSELFGKIANSSGDVRIAGIPVLLNERGRLQLQSVIDACSRKVSRFASDSFAEAEEDRDSEKSECAYGEIRTMMMFGMPVGNFTWIGNDQVLNNENFETTIASCKEFKQFVPVE